MIDLAGIKFMLTAFYSVNFNSINVIGIILFALIMYWIGKLSARSTFARYYGICFTVVILILFSLYDWS